jgi:thiol-disulfide isomerase/thioredoxin
MRDMRARATVFAVTIGLLIASLLLFVGGCSSSSGGTNVTKTPARDFSGVTLDGEQVSLSDYLGKPVVVVFMASWCGPCREESPEIDKFYRENSERAQVLAVAVNDAEADIRVFMNQNGFTFPVMLDGGGVAGAYGVSAIPTTVVVDSEGFIAKRIVGGTTAEALSLIVDGLAGTD